MAALLPNTPIAVSDIPCLNVPPYQTKPICEIIENDVLLGVYGNPALVSDDVVMTMASKKGVPTFGINQHKPFFTSVQVFWTTRGWKAINPRQACKTNSTISIKKLNVGDIVFTLDSSASNVQYIAVKIKSFTEKLSPAGTVFRGIHVREGVTSFHANGFLVSCNSPELTAITLASNIATKLTRDDQQKLFRELEGCCFWDRILGPGVLPAIRYAYDQLHTQKGVCAPKMSSNKPRQVSMKPDLLHSRYIEKLNITSNGQQSPERYVTPEISLVVGTVLRNHKPVDRAQMNGQYVFWSKNLQQNEMEYGAAKLNPSGLLGQAVLSTPSGIVEAELGSGTKYYTVYAQVDFAESVLTNLEAVIEGTGSNLSGYMQRITLETEKQRVLTHPCRSSKKARVKESGETGARLGDLFFDTDASTSVVTLSCPDMATSDDQPYKSINADLNDDFTLFQGYLETTNGVERRCDGILTFIDDGSSKRLKSKRSRSDKAIDFKSAKPVTALTGLEELYHNQVFAQELTTASVPKIPLTKSVEILHLPELEKAYALAERL